MDFLNFRSLKKDQKPVINLLGIFTLIFVILSLVSSSGFAEESKKALTERIGTIDQSKDDHFVIDDCQFKQAPGIKFYTNSKLNIYENRSRSLRFPYGGQPCFL